MATKPLARDLAAWLAAIREGGDDVRAVFADWLRERGYDQAADVVRKRECQNCHIPDVPGGFVPDINGVWYSVADMLGMCEDGLDWRFDHLDDLEPFDGRCVPYDSIEGVVWVCKQCRPAYVAAKAHATRRARRDAAKAAEPDLFSGVE
jgi:uncharacterized protein (TIGR02996 family)